MANIKVEDLFLNADISFNSKTLGQSVPKKKSIRISVSTIGTATAIGTNTLTGPLYDKRYAVERTNV